MIVDEHIHLQDSSDIILNREKEELKQYDLDNFMSQEMNAVGETGLNFYSQSIEQDNFQLAKKKKKKGLKRKNLFKEGEEKWVGWLQYIKFNKFALIYATIFVFVSINS